MAKITPYFYLAFSNPLNDLSAVNSEYKDLKQLFKKARDKTKLHIEFDCCDSFDTEDLRLEYDLLMKRPLALFHFSGHANFESLLLQDGVKNIGTLLKFFSLNTIKILFLNACATAPMVEEIFKNTKVQAVLATNRKVNDAEARKIAVFFYECFIAGNDTLQNAFNKTIFKFGNTALSNSPIEVNRDMVSSKSKALKKLADDTKFSWGLFCSKKEILNITITDLIDDAVFNTEELRKEIEMLEMEIDVATEKEQKFLGTFGREDKDYKEAANAVYQLNQQLELKNSELANAFLQKGMEMQDSELQNQKAILENALNRLNYTKQKKTFASIASKMFSSCTFMGDEYSCLNLLLQRFWKQMKVVEEQTTLYVNYDSSVMDDFWKGLCKYVDLPEHASPESITKKMVDEKYFGNTPLSSGKTHQHLLIEVTCGRLSAIEIAEMITGFWSEVEKYFLLNALSLSDVMSFFHKIFMVIIDGYANENKNIALIDLVSKQSAGLQKLFDIVPLVTDLDLADFSAWYDNSLPESLIDPGESTADIFTQTGGKIKNVLLHVKKKALQQQIDIPMLNQLN